MTSLEKKKDSGALGKAQRDLVALGIAIAAIILFIGTGGTVLPRVIRAYVTGGVGPDHMLVNAMLLNIALIIFGWRRYRELTTEIHIRRQAEEQARLLADTDALTGCLNRRSIAAETERLQQTAAANGAAVAFAMIDLDNFKQVNDMNGHSVGDRVLTEVAHRIRSALPENTLIARLGGDEFAFALSFDPRNRQRIDDLVMRLFHSVGSTLEVAGVLVDITLSVGLTSDCAETQSENTAGMITGETLMHRADIAMYQAKKHGKDRYFWFEPTMEDELRFRNELETGIRRGVANNEFVPYYEQQIDLETGELVGFEMLARWQSPNLGLVSPEIFIPIAEEIGVIAALSEKLISQSFKDAREWAPDLSLAVNISPVQLRDPWFAQKLLKLMVENEFPARRLEIEITESCLHENVPMVRSLITSLRNQGVLISLDDFGTGYSSLEQLRSLPFDRLKIDRSFIRELKDSQAPTKVVDAIISLGRSLNMPITAEGIEDATILAALSEMGKLKGQGYLYGRPESAAQVRDRLHAAGRLNVAAVRPGNAAQPLDHPEAAIMERGRQAGA